MRTTDITATAPRWALTTGTLITVAALAACSTPGHQGTPPSSNSSAQATGVTVLLTSTELAANLKSVSNVTVPWQPTTLSVDPTKVHAAGITAAAKAALAQAHITKIPVDLWVDSRNRPVKMSEKVTVKGQTVSLPATMGQFNQPVTITAPPASQVSTS